MNELNQCTRRSRRSSKLVGNWGEERLENLKSNENYNLFFLNFGNWKLNELLKYLLWKSKRKKKCKITNKRSQTNPETSSSKLDSKQCYGKGFFHRIFKEFHMVRTDWQMEKKLVCESSAAITPLEILWRNPCSWRIFHIIYSWGCL